MKVYTTIWEEPVLKGDYNKFDLQKLTNIAAAYEPASPIVYASNAFFQQILNNENPQHITIINSHLIRLRNSIVYNNSMYKSKESFAIIVPNLTKYF